MKRKEDFCEQYNFLNESYSDIMQALSLKTLIKSSNIHEIETNNVEHKINKSILDAFTKYHIQHTN